MNDSESDPSKLPRRALRINDFCKAYGISRATAYKLIARGELRSVLIAGRRVVPVDVAEALLRPDAA
jgi:predicted DNA-binding transcriptional regulator AlpA